MRIVTFAALFTFIMLGGVYARNVVPVAGWHGEFCVAADTKLPTPVDGQFLWIIRMIERGAMTVLAGDRGMMCTFDFLDFVVMALVAVRVTFVFRRVILPFLLIA